MCGHNLRCPVSYAFMKQITRHWILSSTLPLSFSLLPPSLLHCHFRPPLSSCSLPPSPNVIAPTETVTSLSLSFSRPHSYVFLLFVTVLFFLPTCADALQFATNADNDIQIFENRFQKARLAVGSQWQELNMPCLPSAEIWLFIFCVLLCIHCTECIQINVKYSKASLFFCFPSVRLHPPTTSLSLWLMQKSLHAWA